MADSLPQEKNLNRNPAGKRVTYQFRPLDRKQTVLCESAPPYRVADVRQTGVMLAYGKRVQG